MVLYDDSCRFCRAMAELAWRWDGQARLGFLPWCHPLARGWMAGLNPDVRDASMHVMLRGGRLVSGPVTFALLLSALPGVAWMGRLGLRRGVVGRVLGGAYMLAARNREVLSRVVPYRDLVVREPRLR